MISTVKRGNVFYADLSPVVGSEQAGVRPVVVLQNDIGNRHSPTTIVAAMTSIMKKNSLPTHVSVDTEFLEEESTILLEQIRTVDKQRLSDYLGSLDDETMKNINQAIAVSLGLEQPEVWNG